MPSVVDHNRKGLFVLEAISSGRSNNQYYEQKSQTNSVLAASSSSSSSSSSSATVDSNRQGLFVLNAIAAGGNTNTNTTEAAGSIAKLRTTGNSRSRSRSRRGRGLEKNPRSITTTTALSYSSQAISDENDSSGSTTAATTTSDRKMVMEKSSIQIQKRSTSKRSSKYYVVDRWNAMYDRLVQYKTDMGDTNVPKKYNDVTEDGLPEYPHLGNWVSKQRYEYAQVYQQTAGQEGQITPERIQRLAALGFVWELGRDDEWDNKWNTHFQQLQHFQRKYNSTKVPILVELEKTRPRPNSDISRDQDFDDDDTSEEKEHKEEEASAEVESKRSYQYFSSMSSLGRWAKTQRIQRNKFIKTELEQPQDQNNSKTMDTKERLFQSSSFRKKMEDRITKLNTIQFEWAGKRTTEYDKWLGMYFKLLFCCSSAAAASTSATNPYNAVALSCSSRLIKWSDTQRTLYHEELISPHRIALLNEIPNFDWTLNSTTRSLQAGSSRNRHGVEGASSSFSSTSWEDNYQALVEYYATYNSTLISTTVNDRLSVWTQQQRDQYNSKTLPHTQIAQLNTIQFEFELEAKYNVNFTFTPIDISWYSMYERLLSYQSKYATTIVPNQHGYDRPLANWVNNNRVKLGKYVINTTETEEEDDDENVWEDIAVDTATVSYDTVYYEELLQQIADDIGCHPNDHFLPRGFVQKLSPKQITSRIRQLNEIQFVWDVQDVQWHEMYEQYAKQYYHEDNDTLSISSIPTSNYNTNNNKKRKNNNSDNTNNSKELLVWAKIQRKLKLNQELSKKRTKLLDRIDFVWEPQSDHWFRMYEQLRTYAKHNHGSTLVPRDGDTISSNNSESDSNSATSTTVVVAGSASAELGLWCHTQRRAYKRKTLSKERIKALNSIHFSWDASVQAQQMLSN